MEWWQALMILIASGVIADMLIWHICKAVIVVAALKEKFLTSEDVKSKIKLPEHKM